ncbi:putative transcriptional regulator YdeE [Paenibacillus cellulosilyticus]|uniref:Putative transcriptional regulator YdeE n=1 Tax=Paenibacillus cellulosilyticus TaxID=375489 RepID=A0A2V2Z983_9BACL|nr:effector binding domain-containing protein [Paenibacillus cellulosilyticus]PWW08671.1 putative transcriptional regulator YdeE [Paenibacillus cellulosilyticus]QKS48237.1 effector binding domain-containing protein [Paenibacillus cellulosilyticus]
MEQVKDAMLVTKEAFVAVGLKWVGTFAGAAAGEIRAMHTEFINRVHEVKHVINPDKLLGLSHHINGEDGFTHYGVVEVSHVEDIPEGMITIELPTLTYAKCEHRKGQTINASYSNIFSWIERNGYKLHVGDVTHFEIMPMDQDPYTSEPEFDILIPVEV